MSFDGATSYTNSPGKPMLPYKTYKFNIKGKVRVNSVNVNILKFKCTPLKGKIKPAPNPLPLSPHYIGVIKKLMELNEDKTVYDIQQYFFICKYYLFR